MKTRQVESVLKKLGYTLISDNRHVKCIDKDGNIRVMSRKYLKRAVSNSRFFRTILSNRSLYMKNKDPNKMTITKENIQ